MEDSTETTRASVNKKIESFTEGDLDHATEIISALWEIANKDGDVKAPANASPAVSSFHLFPLLHVIRECSPDITRPCKQRAPHIGRL